MNPEPSNIRVGVLASTGLGGTEKAATIYATELAVQGYDVDYLAAKGPRTEFLTKNGVRVLDSARSEAALSDYIIKHRPDVIHQHVPGYPTTNHLYPVLKKLGAQNKPKVIETNVFGRLEDPESEELIDFRMFISMASAAQAFRRAGIKEIRPFLDRHTVLYYPVHRPASFDPEERNKFREELGLAANEILAVRIGRPSHKWAAWECEAFAIARKQTPTLRLLLMEPPSWLLAKIKAGNYGDGLIVRKETSDFAWLEKLYASADLMIHASDWGESFGYTIAEGMAAELPVITRSTPWCDNAQVELVKNEQTGFVCWSVPEIARRLTELARDTTTRREMGMAAQRRILALADAARETNILEGIILFCLGKQRDPKLTTRNMDLAKFIECFPDLERKTSESFSCHPMDFAAASLYCFYRCSRAQLRATLNRWQRSGTVVPI